MIFLVVILNLNVFVNMGLSGGTFSAVHRQEVVDSWVVVVMDTGQQSMLL